MSGRPWAQGDARRDAILAFVEGYWHDNGRGPIYREIAAAVGLASPSSVCRQVQILRDAGCLDVVRRQPRTIRVVEP